MIQHLGAGRVRFTFQEPVDEVVYLVGDFCRWDETAHPMQRSHNGTQEVTLRLPPGEYELKYKCGGHWFNDPSADIYVRNCWGSENSVAVVLPCETEKVVQRGPGAAAGRVRPDRPEPWIQPGA